MGFLGLFGKSGNLKKHVTRVANKRAQAVDRWDSIQALSAAKTEEAVEALITRFAFSIDPRITDQEEKDLAFRGIIGAGDVAIPPLLRSLKAVKSDGSISWPIKMLKSLLDEERLTTELLALLEDMDTEYERDPEKKHQTLAQLSDRSDPRIRAAAVRFLDDVNEPCRFYAASAVLAQADAQEAQAELEERLIEEESVRVRAHILDGFIEHEYVVAKADAIRPQLPSGYSIDGKTKRVRKS